MADWAAKRFWKSTDVAPLDDGFGVTLDGRHVKTPAKRSLVVPTQALAEAIAQEWDAQQDVIAPATMPLTRTANSAIDTVALNFDHVVDTLAQYGESDLVCYHAQSPQSLVEQQAAAWQPLREWSKTTLSIELEVGEGVMFVPQPDGTKAAFASHLRGYSIFELAALHDLVTISGSIVIGLAAAHKMNRIADLWAASIVDELWNIAQWGEDEEQMNFLNARQGSFETAYRFFELCQNAK